MSSFEKNIKNKASELITKILSQLECIWIEVEKMDYEKAHSITKEIYNDFSFSSMVPTTGSLFELKALLSECKRVQITIETNKNIEEDSALEQEGMKAKIANLYGKLIGCLKNI
jgi:hypothetical protein